ncbi:MAG: glycerophosphodiester phosphodiesterase [Verrucomicrobiota bacterium]|jgi:glycerophosphoryl diester phosphodiesterase|nr:glycerophosphodiester phosphodiesterase [Verrucomicrobiota bacterium]
MKKGLLIGLCALAAGVAGAQEKGLVYAHRGGSYEFEENTLSAFQGSYAKGLRGFETDVRMTKDGELVILHDDKMERMYDGAGRVEDKTAAELRAIKSKKGGQPFLFLDELLAFFSDKPGVYFEFEMKTGDKNFYTEELLETYCKKLHDRVLASRPAGSFYVFTSFDQRPLKTIKRIDPAADILYITGGACTEAFVKTAQELGAGRIACAIDVTTRAQVRAAQKAGFRVNVWPGHTVEDYRLGVALGADALCTDIPVKVSEYKNSQK